MAFQKALAFSVNKSLQSWSLKSQTARIFKYLEQCKPPGAQAVKSLAACLLKQEKQAPAVQNGWEQRGLSETVGELWCFVFPSGWRCPGQEECASEVKMSNMHLKRERLHLKALLRRGRCMLMSKSFEGSVCSTPGNIGPQSETNFVVKLKKRRGSILHKKARR